MVDENGEVLPMARVEYSKDSINDDFKNLYEIRFKNEVLAISIINDIFNNYAVCYKKKISAKFFDQIRF